jgi:hypothetical protein
MFSATNHSRHESALDLRENYASDYIGLGSAFLLRFNIFVVQWTFRRHVSGRSVTKIKAGALSIIFGLGLCVGPLAIARTSFAQDTAPTHSTKSRKAYLKHQTKEQKKISKAQKKAQQKDRKLHSTGS